MFHSLSAISWLILPLTLFAEERIMGGREALLGEVPSMVSIRSKAHEIVFGAGHKCGGALIDATTVLSAAHCFVNLKLV